MGETAGARASRIGASRSTRCSRAAGSPRGRGRRLGACRPRPPRPRRAGSRSADGPARGRPRGAPRAGRPAVALDGPDQGREDVVRLAGDDEVHLVEEAVRRPPHDRLAVRSAEERHDPGLELLHPPKESERGDVLLERRAARDDPGTTSDEVLGEARDERLRAGAGPKDELADALRLPVRLVEDVAREDAIEVGVGVGRSARERDGGEEPFPRRWFA